MSERALDVVVLGGGIMGSTTALHLAEAGMRVAVLDRRGLCSSASGVNAGTLSLLNKRVGLIPYALRSLDLWETMAERSGVEVGYRRIGGLSIAFTEEEAEAMRTHMEEKRQAGAPIEIVDAARARELEPSLSSHVVLASFCPFDGFANSALTGLAYRKMLLQARVDVREGFEVTALARDGDGFAVTGNGATLRARRLVMAGGAWLGTLTRNLGASLPVRVRINQVAVTERYPKTITRVLVHANGFLTLKQSTNGTVLIGGGWQGSGTLDEGRTDIVMENLIGNLRLAQHTIPALAKTRLVRTWHGFEGFVADYMPLAGELNELPNAFVVGCTRGGFTIGPYVGKLLAEHILGKETELPLFDPNRFQGTTGAPLRPALEF